MPTILSAWRINQCFVAALYITLNANSKNAITLQELYEVISSHKTKQPDGIFIVDADFN